MATIFPFTSHHPSPPQIFTIQFESGAILISNKLQMNQYVSYYLDSKNERKEKKQ